MIAGQKVETVWQDVFDSMAKAVLGFARNDAGLQQISHVAIESDLSQADNNSNLRQSFNLCRQVCGAVANLLRCGFVAGRSTADDRGDPGVAEFQTVVAMSTRWLAGEAQFMQDGIHEIAGAISSEGAARSISSMRAGSQPKDENAGAGIAKS